MLLLREERESEWMKKWKCAIIKCSACLQRSLLRASSPNINQFKLRKSVISWMEKSLMCTYALKYLIIIIIIIIFILILHKYLVLNSCKFWEIFRPTLLTEIEAEEFKQWCNREKRNVSNSIFNNKISRAISIQFSPKPCGFNCGRDF